MGLETKMGYGLIFYLVHFNWYHNLPKINPSTNISPPLFCKKLLCRVIITSNYAHLIVYVVSANRVDSKQDSTINIHTSAISATHLGFGGTLAGQYPLVCCLFTRHI